MKKQRKKHAAEFKARVALEARRGLKTVSEITAEYESHPVMVGNWKKDMLVNLPELFHDKKPRQINGPGQVWAVETYIPMRRRFMYFFAIIDWYSARWSAGSYRRPSMLDFDFRV